MATRIGHAQLNGRWLQRVATRIGLAQPNERWQQQVATRIGLAQLNGWWQRGVATRIGLAQRGTYTNVVDASGNSLWARSALDLYGVRRREWQLAMG